MLPIAVLGGIGHSVSLLVARLAFTDVAAEERAAISVLMASALAAVIAVIVLRVRGRTHPIG